MKKTTERSVTRADDPAETRLEDLPGINVDSYCYDKPREELSVFSNIANI
jgi:hypothetical protein